MCPFYVAGLIGPATGRACSRWRLRPAQRDRVDLLAAEARARRGAAVARPRRPTRRSEHRATRAEQDGRARRAPGGARRSIRQPRKAPVRPHAPQCARAAYEQPRAGAGGPGVRRFPEAGIGARPGMAGRAGAGSRAAWRRTGSAILPADAPRGAPWSPAGGRAGRRRNSGGREAVSPRVRPRPGRRAGAPWPSARRCPGRGRAGGRSAAGCGTGRRPRCGGGGGRPTTAAVGRGASA